MRPHLVILLVLSFLIYGTAEVCSQSKPRTQFFAKADDTFVRHSEGTAVELNDGRLFLIWQEFRMGERDSDYFPARLVAKTSADSARTWDGYRSIVEIDPGDINVFSPSLLRRDDGAIVLAFLRKHDFEKPGDLYTPTSAFTLISRDECETFEPLGTIWSRGRQHLCNNTLKQLSTGRLIIPSDRDNSSKDNPDNWACGCMYSDDGGETWTSSENYTTLPKRGGMEPHIEELTDGRLLMVMRTDLGAIYKSESSDHGQTWSAAESLGIESPQSCPELLKDPQTGHLVLIWNAAKYDPQWFSHQGKRTPLSAAVSKDDGKTWSKPRHIETDPKRAFSNPGALFTSDGKLFVNYWTCEYQENGAMVGYPIDLKIAIVDSKWLYE